MKRWQTLLLCSLLGAASLPAMACFTVYDRGNNVVYNAQTPPVDMSQPLHETLPKRFPGGHMVISEGKNCPLVQPNPLVAERSSGSPLLTDRETAESLNVPHTVLPSGAVVVPQRPAQLPPLPRPAAGKSSSAKPVQAVPVAQAAARPASPRGTVITEMHTPPLVAVQVGNSVTLSNPR
jgi:hypothetical protein